MYLFILKIQVTFHLCCFVAPVLSSWLLSFSALTSIAQSLHEDQRAKLKAEFRLANSVMEQLHSGQVHCMSYLKKTIINKILDEMEASWQLLNICKCLCFFFLQYFSAIFFIFSSKRNTPIFCNLSSYGPNMGQLCFHFDSSVINPL